MENITKQNANIVLNKNRCGLTMVRRNYKTRSIVTVRASIRDVVATYRFNNLELDYKTQYMNWQNLDCCGGWGHSKEDLINQFIGNKKLFADIFIRYTNSEYEYVRRKIEECESLENIIVCYNYKSDESIDAILVKNGCVADYIDVKKVLKDYEKFGVNLDDENVSEIMNLVQHPMVNFADRISNEFQFDYANPASIGQYIFNGMLLGYPIESTISICRLDN